MNNRLDVENLQARFKDRPELLETIYKEFNHQVKKDIPEMSSALEISDLDTLRKKAHALKGNAALIGAMLVQELALDIEQASQKGDIEHIRSSWPGLIQEVEITLNELQKFITDQRK